MLEALAMEFGHCVLFLLQPVYAVQQRECDLFLGIVIVVGSAIVYGALELANRLDQPLRLFSEVMFLFRDDVELVM